MKRLATLTGVLHLGGVLTVVTKILQLCNFCCRWRSKVVEENEMIAVLQWKIKLRI